MRVRVVYVYPDAGRGSAKSESIPAHCPMNLKLLWEAKQGIPRNADQSKLYKRTTVFPQWMTLKMTASLEDSYRFNAAMAVIVWRTTCFYVAHR